MYHARFESESPYLRPCVYMYVLQPWRATSGTQASTTSPSSRTTCTGPRCDTSRDTQGLTGPTSVRVQGASLAHVCACAL